MYVQRNAPVAERLILLGALTTAGMLVACGGRESSSSVASNQGGATASASNQGGATASASNRGGATASASNQGGATFEARWARTDLAAVASAVFNSVATDGAGNVYAAGGLTAPGTFDFGDHVTASAVFGGYSAVLVKYDSSGEAQSAQTLSASSNGASFQSIAFDSSGNLYAAGYVSGASGTVDFGNGITVSKSAAYDDALLVKYNSLRYSRMGADCSVLANRGGHRGLEQLYFQLTRRGSIRRCLRRRINRRHRSLRFRQPSHRGGHCNFR